jgi:hypothetical protein
MEFWAGSFGSEYTKRNLMNVHKQDEFYNQQYGITRTEMNEFFLKGLQIDKILEVDCNVGSQLNCLNHMGTFNLYGTE